MSNRKKETLAVNAIERETLRVGSYLVAEIPVGDKAPSFDGKITVYKDDSERKESYINEVPTQVKGTSVKKFSTGNRNFRLDIVHYENYYKRGGCLLLVVEILENTETKIFYKQLLPIELKQIISTWGHQKTFNVELRPLEETTLYSVCRKFIDQMIRQPQMLIEKNQYKDDDYEKLIFTSLTFNPNRGSFDDIFNHDFIQFGLKDNIEYPIRNMRIGEIAIDQKERVDVGGKIFEVMVETHYSPDKITLIIEGCLDFTMQRDGKKLNFRINEVKSLAAQLKILPLLIEFLKSGKIRFKDFYGEILVDEAQEYVTELERTYTLFLDLQKVFLQLNIDENIQFGNKDNIQKEIEQLIRIILYKDYSKVKFENPDTASFIKYTIGDIYLIFFYNPTVENKITNAFTEDILNMPVRMVFTQTNEAVPISPYLLLEKETLINAKNLNYDVMIQSFDSLDYKHSELIFAPINNFCLVCLNAFDTTGNQELLRLPLTLLTKLKEETVDEINKNIIAINLLQTKYRQTGEFTQQDYKELMNLRERTVSLSESLELRFCISVLLQSKKEADLLFEEFENEKKEFYKTLPIFFLYQALK